ncbi:hypothetical protein PHISCL_02953 [Aspergillus sclerotialis]|uniref:CorA-like Mg2+ transporter protein n=1 Tax=Aspergillus sclerotialis TaxID=2070753 RepID=A0A3A2ZN63_9EURO|nr:hypothetical protein PHISCL_02953 [Aspergillus sclerotialis]
MSTHSRDYVPAVQTSSLNPNDADIEAHPCPHSPLSPNSSPTTKPPSAEAFTTSAVRVTSRETIKHRVRRSNTARSYHRDSVAHDPNWHPGTEPGIDPAQPLPPYGSDGTSAFPTDLHQRCEITVVDFSQHEMRQYQLDNETLESFLAREKEPWVQCRWINVNGLSWDVIRMLGNFKGLHRLAIEDLIHTSNRTKVDWYSDHAFVLLTLQKLVKIHEDSGDEDEEENGKIGNGDGMRKERNDSVVSEKSVLSLHPPSKKGVILEALVDLFRRNRPKQPKPERGEPVGTSVRPGPIKQSTGTSQFGEDGSSRTTARSIQRYRGGPNEDRIEFMERHASLASKGLCVTLEQVSIFLHADNTVTSFFETSADDIEAPIVRRLSSSETILRQSCDASMLLQAILDGIIDLAIPVTMAYQDTIGDLELGVLTDPDVDQSKCLYILTSEIAILRNFMQPIVAVINALRDHRSEPISTPGVGILKRATGPSPFIPPTAVETQPESQNGLAVPNLKSTGGSSVTISPLCYTYLGDALDHCITIVEGYDQMRRAADNMIDLIFNTIGAYQNGSMKQLTLVTCLYLPLTFLTVLPARHSNYTNLGTDNGQGYFGMNFNTFPALEHTDAYFWKIAVPFVCATTMILMRDKIQRSVVLLAQRRLIVSGRKQRRERKAGRTNAA